ncbi:hypothetical protein EHS13_14855 [Paenibacillus psychroresistens]|uniref:Uncharacterized protein n=1 Tax=Paenibacillus psychroresistens TaxID=1778678 RepID=A0A6B8RJZ7_9BACL|nr:hypothetical protein [Paenibacillus psychroresistens]QGQ96064.1 hypothetical protein EHS13_14855 [Paenibacillus psychroresistens]
MEILYPEYNHLFTFFDFHNFRADGGTAYLAKLLKSFSAAKIKNRIIAIFDNDTAVELEIQSLSTVPILDSIKIMKLPILDFCMSYPTIGPTGRHNSNINGSAVSIELFFGEDIIKDKKIKIGVNSYIFGIPSSNKVFNIVIYCKYDNLYRKSRWARILPSL